MYSSPITVTPPCSCSAAWPWRIFWPIGAAMSAAAPGPRRAPPRLFPSVCRLPPRPAMPVASAFRIRQQPRVAVTTCGDGATSKGDFLESLNLAGVWQLPLVFVVNNNQWAISVPRHLQSAAPTLAHKALAAGIPGEQVDGNDVLAVYDRLVNAIERARAGKGPVLVECVTYRLGDHTASDDASRYRSADELAEAWKREPIGRLQRFLHRQ